MDDNKSNEIKENSNNESQNQKKMQKNLKLLVNQLLKKRKQDQKMQ